MITFIAKCLYLMLPAYIGNMIPVFARKIDFLDYPVDLKKRWKNKRLLGDHKTWRGFFFGTAAAVFIAFIQKLLYRFPAFSYISFIDYNQHWLAAGFLLGFGALFGDSVKSFFKRRAAVKPGKAFIPWDQLDYSIGALALIAFIFTPSWQIIITVLIANFILHVAANHIAFYLGLKESRW